MIAAKIEALLAYRGYDADAIRQELANAEVEAVIPSKRTRRQPAPCDRDLYKRRNLIERMFAAKVDNIAPAAKKPFVSAYCWSHGHCGHSSAACNHRYEGHNSNAKDPSALGSNGKTGSTKSTVKNN